MATETTYRVFRDEESRVKSMNRRLKMADTAFDKLSDEYETFLARYAGKYRNPEDQPIVRGHKVMSMAGIAAIDTNFSGLVAVDVEFLLKAIGRGTSAQAYAATKALNQVFRDSKANRRLRYAVKDAHLVDIGWVKVYYEYAEDIRVEDRPEDEIVNELKEIDAIAESEDITLTPELARKLGVELVREVRTVTRDRICVDHVPWNMIRWDPEAKYIEDVTWVAQYTVRPRVDVINDPVYKAFVSSRYGPRKGPRKLREIAADTTLDKELRTNAGKDEFGDDDRVTLVEFWDFRTGLVTVFLKGQDTLILHERPNPLMVNPDYEDRNPFKPLILRDNPESLQGIGDMRLSYDTQRELDLYRSNQLSYVTRFVPKMYGPDGALTDAGKKALQSQEWGAYVGVEAGALGQISALQPPTIPQEVFGIPEKVVDEIREATGVSQAARGVFPTGRKTATLVNAVERGGATRQAEKVLAYTDWLIAIGKTTLQLMQVFYDKNRMLRFVNDAGAEFEWSWSSEDVSLDADIQVAITPRELLSRDERVQRAFEFLNLILIVPETDRASAIQWAAQEMGVDPEIIRTLIKSPQETDLEARAQAALRGVQPATSQQPPGLALQLGGR